MDVLLVAIRYLLARPISLISWLGVVVGVVAIVVVDSVMGGFLESHETLLRGSTPDVVVELPRELRRDEAALERLAERLTSLAHVRSCGLRSSWPALYRPLRPAAASAYFDPRGSDSSFVQIRGIDDENPGERAELRALVENDTAEPFLVPAEAIRPYRLDDPLWFDAQDARFRSVLPEDFQDSAAPLPPVLFGESLFLQGRMRRGQVVSLVTLGEQDEHGVFPKKKAYFVVVGSFRAEDFVVNETTAIVRRGDLLRFLGIDAERPGERAQEVAIGVDFAEYDDAVCASVQAVGAPHGIPPEAVKTWREQKADLLKAIHNERSFMNFALLFLVLIAAFNLLVTLSMMVNEKVREIGVLTAMGWSPGRVVRLFLTCGALLSFFGVAFGLVGGLLIADHLDALNALFRRITGMSVLREDLFTANIPSKVEPLRIAVLVSITLVGTLLLTVWPSWRAGRLNAVDALRQES